MRIDHQVLQEKTQSTANSLGSGFISAFKIGSPAAFTYSFFRTESAAVEGFSIICKFDPAPSGESGGTARPGMFKSLGVQPTAPIDSLNVLLAVARNLPKPLNEPFTNERFASMVIAMINGEWSNIGGAWPGWTYDTTANSDSNLGDRTSIPFGLFTTPKDIRISVRYIVTVPWIPFSYHEAFAKVDWLGKRNPRKWGRSITERWDEEHKRLVAHRKFHRNTQKMKKDPNAAGFGRTGTGIASGATACAAPPLKMSSWAARNKAIGMENAVASVEALFTRNKKSITKKAAKKLVMKMKKRIRDVKKKAKAWQPKIRRKRKN